MCGLAGFLDPKSLTPATSMSAMVDRMTARIIHRGPDAGGHWVDAGAGIALGHRRLSILDLSPEGGQPMHSRDGRWVIAFNGEIYNHKEVRSELDGSGHGGAWRGRSDTEVMLEALAAWGVGRGLSRFTGMFAFALWDKRERTLTLACDRMGEKPLYYGWSGGTFLFGSELKALQAAPSWQGEIDRGGISLLMRYNYIPAPHCIYKGMRKLSPAEVVTLRAGRPGADGEEHSVYWTAKDAVVGAKREPLSGSPSEITDQLDRQLRSAVAQQMEADVPLGAFLSGGVDSSIIVALMQAQSSRPVKTFTIGFNSAGHDEAIHAKEIAAYLGTEHRELYLDWDKALETIDRLPVLYDEPFADSSQLPTYLVAKLAREHVTVCLSGDGGDEVFGGYNRHTWGPALWKKIGWMPRGMRRTAASALASVGPQSWDKVFSSLGRILPRRLAHRNPGEKLHKLAQSMGATDPVDMYRGFLSQWRRPEDLVLGGREPSTRIDQNESWPELPNLSELMMYLDTIGYLPGDILTKVDRAGMAVGLESRMPFLNHRLLEFAWRIPLGLKIREGQGKWILRQVLYRYVPKEMIERPKMGFAVPIGAWLRGPLREWAESLLAEDRLLREGYFNPAPIRERWGQHLSGKRDWQSSLWGVLMFQSWLQGR